MAWVLTKGLQTVRAEFDRAFPGRDKGSDGSVGDLAHQGGSSGHNPDRTGRAEWKDGDLLDEVRAIDVDRDLVPGADTDWMMKVVQHVVTGLRAGRYSPVPIRYIIYKRTIWHVSQGWASRAYTGSNAHDQHAHFSGGWSAAADGWTGSLGLAEVRGESEEGGTDMLVKQGDTGQEVKFWQYVLASLGYPVGDIDGVYGPKMNTAVNAYRNKFAAAGSGSATMITGWQGWHMLAQMMSKYAGLPGAPGKDGAAGRDGKDGRDGVFTGTLNITGGTLSAVAPTQGS